MNRAEILDTARHMVTPDKLHKLLICDAEKGFLYWRERPGCNAQTRSWNTRYAGKRAITHLNQAGYYTGTVLAKGVKAHRVVWAMTYGDWPDVIDHIDGDRLNNTISNLRSTDFAGNAKNAKLRKDSVSGRVGVYRRRNGVWSARIQADGREIHLGSFGSFSAACAARARAEQQYSFHVNHGRR